MPLPAPNLDDRRFQDIVDEAKRLIPRYCPEWTDHNVSDPGVALIELFAWMTEMLLYRVNQVPDKLYIKFLDMIGMRLAPPVAAEAPVTFYLSAAQPSPVTIPRDTEVATVRTETSPAIIFTTKEDLTIQRLPAQPLGIYTRNRSRNDPSGWTAHDLRNLGAAPVGIFPPQPEAGDAFYLAFEQDLSQYVLALVLGCELPPAQAASLDRANPPWAWQTWTGGPNPWQPCTVEDSTAGFTKPGEIILLLPKMARQEISGVIAYWVRCVLTDTQNSGPSRYKGAPTLKSLRQEARGGTTVAHQAVTVRNEILGYSDGTPGQEFTLRHTPVLLRDTRQEYLAVRRPDGETERWQEMPDFANSQSDDRHYLLDSLEGTLALAPALRQPDGTFRAFGAVPPAGSELRMTHYQYGGGADGNVAAHTLTVLKSSIPFVARVTNWQAAAGGRDAQQLDDAKLRAPEHLRTLSRAMTEDDYEYLAERMPGVARARCIGPRDQSVAPAQEDPKPGEVYVIVLPRADEVEGYIEGAKLQPDTKLRNAVKTELDRRRPLGIAVKVNAPNYLWVSVEVTLRAADQDAQILAAVQREATAALYRYLNPYVGGPRGQGWPFGRDLHGSELYGLLQRIANVEVVELGKIQVSTRDPDSAAKLEPMPARLIVHRDTLICSGRHQVQVKGP